MNDTLKGILIGVVSSLIASGIIYAITKQFVWNATLPLWVWLAISILLVVLVYVIKWGVRKYRVRVFISEFNEGSFGDSYDYIWKYKRSKDDRNSAYGYEATDIRTKKPLSEMNNEHVHTFGYEIPETTIKMLIQLTIIANIDKAMGKKLVSCLEYLEWTIKSSNQ